MWNNCPYRALYRAWTLYRHSLLNRYAATLHMWVTQPMYSWGYRPNIFHICAKTQPTTIHTSHIIAKYVLETNMPTRLGIYAIYAKYLKDLSERCIHLYEQFMKSLQSTIWQWALYAYLTYIIEQVCLPHCTYMFHCTATVVHLWAPH